MRAARACAVQLPPHSRWRSVLPVDRAARVAGASLAAFNDKHNLTVAHYGLKNKGEIAPFGVKFIPHHVAISVGCPV